MILLPQQRGLTQSAQRDLGDFEQWLGKHFKRLRRSGRGWTALCPAHPDAYSSLTIGVGDNGRLLLHRFVGCRFADILQAARVSLSDLDVANVDHPHTRGIAERIAYARKFWENSTPATGTIAETYLRSRGLTLPIPRSLRFIPMLLHREFGASFPAMVSGIQDVAGKFAGVQITWLCADGSDKAPATPPRKTFGPVTGAAVRLAHAFDQVALGEGVETILSVQQCTSLPGWACLGVNGLRTVELPPHIREVVICADADRPGVTAAEFLRQRMLAEGRRARIALPSKGKDFNEALL